MCCIQLGLQHWEMVYCGTSIWNSIWVEQRVSRESWSSPRPSWTASATGQSARFGSKRPVTVKTLCLFTIRVFRLTSQSDLPKLWLLQISRLLLLDLIAMTIRILHLLGLTSKFSDFGIISSKLGRVFRLTINIVPTRLMKQLRFAVSQYNYCRVIEKSNSI